MSAASEDHAHNNAAVTSPRTAQPQSRRSAIPFHSTPDNNQWTAADNS